MRLEKIPMQGTREVGLEVGHRGEVHGDHPGGRDGSLGSPAEVPLEDRGDRVRMLLDEPVEVAFEGNASILVEVRLQPDVDHVAQGGGAGLGTHGLILVTATNPGVPGPG